MRNAIKLFAKAVANAREHDTRDGCALEYSSSSLGVGKRTASWRRRSAPCAAPEAALQMPGTICCALMMWMVRHAASGVWQEADQGMTLSF